MWTVDEYHRMIETEILTTDERVELLEGQILEMSPQQPPHAATTQRAFNYLNSLLDRSSVPADAVTDYPNPRLALYLHQFDR